MTIGACGWSQGRGIKASVALVVGFPLDFRDRSTELVADERVTPVGAAFSDLAFPLFLAEWALD